MIRFTIFLVTSFILFVLPSLIIVRVALKKAARQAKARVPIDSPRPPPFLAYDNVEVDRDPRGFSFRRPTSSGAYSYLGPRIEAVPAEVQIEEGTKTAYRAQESYLVFSYLPNGLHGTRVSIGPLEPEAARQLASDFQRLWGLPRVVELIDVNEEALARSPMAFHGKIVRITGTWRTGLEASFLGDHWFTPAPGVTYPKMNEPMRVTAVCLFQCSQDGRPHFGHMGMSYSELRAFEVRQA
ncbi:hypothetical protein LZC95_02255 [Pendulispora brunnea]|uniref:Uncharacterized protein n=1 Tax=Pendulispora brunnea TaxID=2905690 RepID=A0ABZ2KFI7_9BACT